MRESYLKNSVVTWIRKNFPGAWVYHPTDRFRAGIPDLLICINGRLFAIELKVKSNKPTKLQSYVLRRIREAGGVSGVCRSLDDVKQFFFDNIEEDFLEKIKHV